jgi:hypothetical protein
MGDPIVALRKVAPKRRILLKIWTVSLGEKMPFRDWLYFAFVTGLAIGCADTVVKNPLRKIGGPPDRFHRHSF